MKPTEDIVPISGSGGRIGDAVSKRSDNVVGFDHEAPAPPSPDGVRTFVDMAFDESVHEGLCMSGQNQGRQWGRRCRGQEEPA